MAGRRHNTNTSKGTVVFAEEAYTSGDLVESCPVRVLLPSEHEQFSDVHFNWDAMFKPDEEDSVEPVLAITTSGNGEVYSHAIDANLKVVANLVTGNLDYIARKPISAGEELTVNYDNPKGYNETLHWLSQKGIEYIPPLILDERLLD